MWEIILLIAYALGSTWMVVDQSNEIGELNARFETANSAAAQCRHDATTERRNATLAASRRAVNEKRNEDSFTEYRSRQSEDLPDPNDTCASASSGVFGNRLVSDTERLVEELRTNRVSP